MYRGISKKCKNIRFVACRPSIGCLVVQSKCGMGYGENLLDFCLGMGYIGIVCCVWSVWRRYVCWWVCGCSMFCVCSVGPYGGMSFVSERCDIW